MSGLTYLRPDGAFQSIVKLSGRAAHVARGVNLAGLSVAVDGSMPSPLTDDFSLRLRAETRDQLGPILKPSDLSREILIRSGAPVPHGRLIDRLRPPDQTMIEVKPRPMLKVNLRPSDVHFIPD